MGGNYPLVDRSFNTSLALGNLLDDTLPNNNNDYDQRSMFIRNGPSSLPPWSIPPMNFTSTPIVK